MTTNSGIKLSKKSIVVNAFFIFLVQVPECVISEAFRKLFLKLQFNFLHFDSLVTVEVIC